MRISKYAKQKHGHWAACHKLRINWEFFFVTEVCIS